jgi:hypothetical protein
MAKHSAPLKATTLPSFREGLTKKDILQLADGAVDTVLEEGNVFGVAEALAAMEAFVKSVRQDERYVQFLRDELAKHHGKIVTASGAKIELCEAGVSYDYSANGDWRILDAQIRLLQDRKKKLEEELRRIAPGQLAVDPETGEVVEGAFKSSKSTYRITLMR